MFWNSGTNLVDPWSDLDAPSCRDPKARRDPGRAVEQFSGPLPETLTISATIWRQEEAREGVDKKNWLLHPIEIGNLAAAAMRLPSTVGPSDLDKWEIQFVYDEVAKSTIAYSITIGSSAKDKRLSKCLADPLSKEDLFQMELTIASKWGARGASSF